MRGRLCPLSCGTPLLSHRVVIDEGLATMHLLPTCWDVLDAATVYALPLCASVSRDVRELLARCAVSLRLAAVHSHICCDALPLCAAVSHDVHVYALNGDVRSERRRTASHCDAFSHCCDLLVAATGCALPRALPSATVAVAIVAHEP